jgi:hypothetical protein
MKKFWTRGSQSEPYSARQVRAELCIREMKKAVRHTLKRTRASKRLWYYCTLYHSELRNFTPHPHFKLHGRIPNEIVTGYLPDISEYLDYSWYETVWYHDQDAPFPETRRKLAKWLGVAHHVGQALCYYILPESGRPIIRSTIQAFTRAEKESEEILNKVKALDRSIKDNIDTLPVLDISIELQDVDNNNYPTYL